MLIELVFLIFLAGSYQIGYDGRMIKQNAADFEIFWLIIQYQRFPTRANSMFYISLHLFSLRALKDTEQQPQLYLRFANIHYFISHSLIIREGITPLNISQSFYLPEEKPTFELMLLLEHSEASKKVLGKAAIDAREWPINDKKTKVIQLSPNISIALTITNTFVTQEQIHEKRITNSQLDFLQQKQKQIEIASLNTYLQHRNLTLLQTLNQLQNENTRLEQQKLKKQREMSKRSLQRKQYKQNANRQLTQLKQQLQAMNVQLGELTNLINTHGQIDICNTVLSLLANTHPQQQ